MKKGKIISLVFCAVLILSVLYGCNNADSTPDEATVNATAEVAATASVTAPAKTELKPEAETDAVTKPQTNPPEETQAENFYAPSYEDVYTEASDNEPCIVNVDGKSYTFYIGDTVNYVFTLTTQEALEDFQASTSYDSGMLELIAEDVTAMFPVAGNAAICNTEMPNIIKYNAVNINGMDFTQGGHMVSFKFRVLDSGSTAIGTTLEYMDSVLSEPYVNDYKIVGDIKYSEEII